MAIEDVRALCERVTDLLKDEGANFAEGAMAAGQVFARLSLERGVSEDAARALLADCFTEQRRQLEECGPAFGPGQDS